LREFLLREAQGAREDRDTKALLAVLASSPGSPVEEELLLPRFLDLVRQAVPAAGSKGEVEASFRARFGLDLRVALTRPPMVFVDGGTYRMGSGDEADEMPIHQVTVTRFLMGRTEVTQEQYSGLQGVNPSLFAQGPDAWRRPVERVSWYDAVEFCIRLSVQDGLEPVYTLARRKPASGFPIVSAEVTHDPSKNGYRLPTEAEWEWAARGGVLARGTALAGGDDPAQVAWTDGTAPGPVATKKANELGLYDMSGNVWEWCNDWYGKYPTEAQTDPLGPAVGILKVGRGGSWHAAAWNARVTSRSYDNPGSRGSNIGFRVVRSLSPAAGN
jgi:formylglycine-generating enzyme required for sulfatase activity